MKEIKWIWYWVSYFFIHSKNEYLVNQIIYDGIGYTEHKLYGYYRVLMLFDVVILINKTNSLGRGDHTMQRWLFDYHDKIILRRYYK